VRADLERLLDDVTLVTLALAIAVGWSLYELAHGVATFVDGLFTHIPTGEGSYETEGLTWIVGHHVVALDGMLVGALELSIALAAAVWVARRSAA
jgi:hypothetical protein